jgi:methanol metabolism-related c-type cytochrome
LHRDLKEPTLKPTRKRLKSGILSFAVAVLVATLCLGTFAQSPAKKEHDGKWENADGTPTYNIATDETVDWYTFSGFRRYHSECHVCHGPDGEGSTYAPSLVESLKTMSYAEFLQIVAGGREVIRADKQSKMPALGENPNVMCYIDDIYIYLKARSDNALPRGRPAKRANKPETAIKNEKDCFGS